MKMAHVVVVVLVLNFTALPVWGQPTKEPSVKEILAATKKTKFGQGKSAARLPRLPETLTFTPVDLPAGVKARDAVVSGLVVGQLKVKNVEGFVDGTYTYFVCKIGSKGDFKLFVVRDGKEIIKDDNTRISVKELKGAIGNGVTFDRGMISKTRSGVTFDITLGLVDDKVLIKLTHLSSVLGPPIQ